MNNKVGNDAGDIRPMSTVSGSNSDEDQGTGQTLPNPKRRRLQFQSPNHSCNESTGNESAHESDFAHCSDVSSCTLLKNMQMKPLSLW